MGMPFNTHTACFLCDALIGGALVWANWQRYRKRPFPCLELAMAVAGFTVLHGIAHLFIGHVLNKATLAAALEMAVLWPISWLLVCFIFMTSFLSLGPYLGFRNGVDLRTCLVAHLVSIVVFISCVPDQFAFGAVQIVINCWYCLPRVLLLGYAKPEEISQRVDDGWALVSIGFLVLMPVVFVEMLACDGLMTPLGGHLLYDASVALLSVMYSAMAWRQCEAVSAKSP